MTARRRIPAGDGGEPAEAAVAAAARAVEAGAVLVHPTETVYGLGASPPEMDRVVARLKGRDPGRPLLRLAPGMRLLRRRHPELAWGRRAERLAECFWPGPVTVVLPDGSPEGRAVRVEGHPVTRLVLERAEATISSTSLNRSGEPPASSRQEVRKVLDAMPEVDADVVWLDAGDLEPSPPSTLVSVLGETPRVLREGAVPAGEIRTCLGEEVARG